ncbi:MAG TPA: alpha/beta hydrolase [Beijerinckiaceae bacterium]|jgi:pimeloyl-ACP methyl ester carboxylesterase
MTSQPFEDLFVSAGDGLRLYARVYGPRAADTVPVVCLPGLARTSADFHDLALALASDQRRPRRVLAVDYRGRGRSEYDRNWRNYDIRVELDDLLQVLTVAAVGEAVFIGTSRGGLITLALSAARPTLLRGVVLNDVGPVIEGKGLARIRGYVGKLPAPRDYTEGGEILKRISNAQFPRATDEDWEILARATWREAKGRLVPDYDVALQKTLEHVDFETPLPPLWHLFAGLAHVPVLAIRGANSDLLSAETLEAMARAHPDLETVTVADQGHVPALRGRDMIQRIKRFVLKVEDGTAQPAPALTGAP